MLPFRRRQNSNLDIRRRQTLQLTQQAVRKLLGQRGAAREDNAAIQGGAEIEIGAFDGVDNEVMQAG